MWTDPLLMIPSMILVTISALVVAYKDDSPRPLGVIAFPVAAMSIAYGSVSFWVAFLVCFSAFMLFMIAMMQPEDRDDILHYSALGIALLGRPVIWVAQNFGGLLKGEAPIWVVLLVLGVILAVVIAWRRGMFKDRFGRKATPSTD